MYKKRFVKYSIKIFCDAFNKDLISKFVLNMMTLKCKNQFSFFYF